MVRKHWYCAQHGVLVVEQVNLRRSRRYLQFTFRTNVEHHVILVELITPEGSQTVVSERLRDRRMGRREVAFIRSA